MTISTQTARVQYAGNGVTASFPVPFEFLTAFPPKVIYTDAAGVDTLWVSGTNYTVTGGGANQAATGAVLPTVVLPTSTKITILRNEALTQAADYVPNDPFPAVAHEKALDRLSMQNQMIAERAGRALVLKESSSASNITVAEPEAGKILGWNADGTAIINKDATSVGVAGTAGAVVFAADNPEEILDYIDGQPHADNLDTLSSTSLGATGLAMLGAATVADATAALGAGVAGATIFTATLDADVRAFLDVPVYVLTRTALKARDTTKDVCAVLLEGGRSGLFKWTAGNFSTQVAADTAEGVYVKATAIASSAGAWVRSGVADHVRPEWFGAIGDNVTDDYPALQAACDFGKPVKLSATTYWCQWVIGSTNKDLFISGAGQKVSAIRFTFAGFAGINFTTNSNRHQLDVTDLSLIADVAAAGTAIRGTWPNVASSAWRTLHVENCEIIASNLGTTYWTSGIDVTEAWKATILKNVIHGNGAGAVPGTGNFGIRFNGLSIECEVSFNGIHAFEKGLTVIGNCEGINVLNNNFIACGWGAYINCPALRPMHSYKGNHVSSYFGGIYLNNVSQSFVSDNLIYAISGWAGAYVGINCQNSSYNLVHHNHICFLAPLSPAGGTGVLLAASGAMEITNNQQQGGNAVVWCQAGTSDYTVKDNRGYNMASGGVGALLSGIGTNRSLDNLP
ncbi:right-handed parallel beta-helix repeat-containing protein [Candidatus Phyllobacterium onerii]|uniref:right-handed parallel beta-helix repeat-containing protein n=1 Tax=Candidatus Phyllobacterium onerii TaxID=3020828 RepID=UPI00232ADAC5|nr:right-handed parallel beta-helix repeat-containing protein [Phyllobacterium sp. IY22]